MKKLAMQTPDTTENNLSKIKELFPNVITEKEGENGVIEKAVDFDQLKQLLSKELVEGGDERYRLDWPGKKASLLKANTPITSTLRPDNAGSVNFDTTENVFIEGDNFEVLKILQESYLGKIKMIYIDPPYNTGKDFVYRDNRTVSKEDYEEELGVEDEEGGKLFRNTDTNGRFHSDWLSMMYERLVVAKDLLCDDGVFFVSIDDSEAINLRKICDEIFGEANFIAQIIVDGTPKNDPYVVSTSHEYCIVYVKNLKSAKVAGYGLSNIHYSKIQEIWDNYQPGYSQVEEKLKEYYSKNNLKGDNLTNYKFADDDGVYRIGPIDDPQNSGPKDQRINPKTGKICKTPNRGWSCTLDTWNEWIEDNLVWFPENDESSPAKKTYIFSDRTDVLRSYKKIQTRKDTDHIKRLFGTPITPFSNPKPRELIYDFVKNCNDKELTVLDFFAGSGTTAEVIFQINNDDNGKRKFICVQLNEEIKVEGATSNKEKKIAKAAIDFLKSMNKPTNISEISMERIRRAGSKIIEENKEKLAERETPLDVGFRVYKTDTTNMKDVYYHPSKLTQDDLFSQISNVKEDRTAEDLLTQVILDLGLTLDLPIEMKSIKGNNVYFVAGNALVACFDDDIDFTIVEEMAKSEPLKAVFKDSSFKKEQDRTNVDTKFKRLSPETVVTVI